MAKVSLPVVEVLPEKKFRKPREQLDQTQRFWRRLGLQCYRASVLVAIVAIIHWSTTFESQPLSGDEITPGRLDKIKAVVSGAVRCQTTGIGGAAWHEVLDAQGGRVALAAFTQPAAADVLGFSGPTDILVVASPDATISHVEIVKSADTRDHVQQIHEDDQFLSSLIGRNISDIKDWKVDAVSGATLTSLAIVQSLRKRLQDTETNETPVFEFSSLRFPDPVRELEEVNARANRRTGLYERMNPEISAEAESMAEGDADKTERWLRVAPVGDTIIGYQGPTDAIIRLDNKDTVLGLTVLESFDNEPYTDYVREDWGFPRLFNGLTLDQLAEVDVESIEGVSGATMTSQAVAKAVVAAARNRQQVAERLRRASHDSDSNVRAEKWLTTRDVSTIGFVIFAVLVANTRLKRYAAMRVTLQVGVIVWMGWLNGDLLSQALWAGWAMHGIAWAKCIGLVALSVAAVLLPVLSGKNTYCSHMCPHGAVQQLLRNRLPLRLRLPQYLQRAMKVIPLLLLGWVIIVAVGRLGFSLVDIEPFDAWVWTVAGWATVVIAFGGLTLSVFSPMAYCRFGCPTGAILNGLRRSGTGWSSVDSAATGLLVLALGCWLVSLAIG